MASEPVSPAVAKLLAMADEVLNMAEDMRARGLVAASLSFALYANDYVRAARAFQDMDDASRALNEVIEKLP